MEPMRRAARVSAHLLVLLLAAAWTTGALISLSPPLFDLARPAVGGVIETAGRVLDLSYGGTVQLAHALAGFKLALGLYLAVTVLIAAYDSVRWGESDDAMLDVGLFLSAFGSGVAAVAFVPVGGPVLIGSLGEIMLAAAAGVLAAFGHGAQWRMADLRRRGDAAIGLAAPPVWMGEPLPRHSRALLGSPA
jgi:hypothetical protein